MLKEAYKEVANLSPNLLWISNKESKFVFFNKAWLQFRGVSLEEELAYNRSGAIHSADQKKVQSKLETGHRKIEPYKVEYRLKNSTGEYRWFLETATPQFNEKKEFAGFMGTCTDIQSLKEFDTKRKEFLIAASHEFRTPLTSLNMYIHLIQEYFNKNEIGDYKVYADNAELQMNRIAKLVDRLLDISNIDRGNLIYVWVNFSMHDLVSGIVESTRTLYTGRSFEFSSSSASTVRGDLTHLTHAIENLLNNAVKYSDAKKKILIDLSEDKSFIYLRITDYGIGIDSKYVPKVFNRFFRTPRTAEQTYPGLGLGLYLTKRVIEKHHGKISVNSEKNVETTFTIKIPIKEKRELNYD